MLFGGQIGPNTFQYFKSDDTAKCSALVLITGAETDSQSKKKDYSVASVSILCQAVMHTVPLEVARTEVLMECVQRTLIFPRTLIFVHFTFSQSGIENGKLKCFSKFLINERKPATFIAGEREGEGKGKEKRKGEK